MAPTYLHKAANPLYAATRAEEKKHRKYAGVDVECDLTLYAFAVEVTGALGLEAKKCLVDIFNHMADSCSSPVLATLREDMLRTIALQVQMGNASMLRIARRVALGPKRPPLPDNIRRSTRAHMLSTGVQPRCGQATRS